MAGFRETIIDRQYNNGISLINFLHSKNQLTLAIEAKKNFTKNLLLSVASFFEKEISETIVEFAKSRSNSDDLVVSIIKIKAIKRQYHTYFDWEKGKNANSFFALFGDDFKTRMVNKVNADPQLEKSIKAFLELGLERNKLVHQNFAEIVIDKTAEEIYDLYKNSLLFIQTMKEELIKKDSEQIEAV